MPSNDVALPYRSQRKAEPNVSVPILSNLKARDRKNESKADCRIVLKVEIDPAISEKVRFDLILEASDEPGVKPEKWYLLGAANNLLPQVKNKDGVTRGPQLTHSSTKVSARWIRATVTPSVRCKFGATVEVI